MINLVFIVIISVALYFIFRPKLDHNLETDQVLLWYGPVSKRKYIILWN